jgi:hypothetical protein
VAEALTAQQILDRVSKAYADCRTYRDSGSVRTVFIDGDGRRTVKKVFATAFVRPERFRFEYSEKRDEDDLRYIVWRQGNEVRSWWDLKPGIEDEPSLGLALAGATGVSSGSAHTVPALLLPGEVGGRRLTSIADATRIGDAELDEAECFRVTGEYCGSSVTIWIEKKTFLVRRIDSERHFDTFRTEETTLYEPSLDGEISDDILTFKPPGMPDA